jgi:hypothetical protein
MKKATASPQAKLITTLQGQVKELQTQLKTVQKIASEEAYVRMKIAKSQARFTRIRKENEKDVGIGAFLLVVEVTAPQDAIYVPLSIASGKKPAGFVYQIEGTGVGSIATASVEARGEGITLVTLGSIRYCRIPQGKKGIFRLQIEIRGGIGKTYMILINRMHFKLSPDDARYKKSQKPLRTRPLQFK